MPDPASHVGPSAPHAALVPHLHSLAVLSHVGAERALLAHESAVPHLHTPAVHTSFVTIQGSVSVPTVPQIHILFPSSHVGPIVFPVHAAAVPH